MVTASLLCIACTLAHPGCAGGLAILIIMSAPLLAMVAIPPQALFFLAALLVFSGIFIVKNMVPKRFYIIRHGETLLNQRRVKQGAEGALSEHGVQQAETVGRYLKHFHPTRIISSPFERAVQTAQILHTHTQGQLVVTPLLAERKSPSEVVGKSTHDPEVIRIVGHTERGYHDDDYRFSDEENFTDMKARAAKCLTYLERTGTQVTVVVTHHALLQMLLSYLLYRDALHASDYVKLAFFNPADNGGITICEYHPWKRFSKTHGWEIIAYNESIG